MEFVVNSGGKVVKALRGSKDEGVRKRAVELTAQWKALVAGQLAAKKVVKKGDKGSEDEAGETWTARGPRTRKAHSARRALYGPVLSAAPPRSTWAEPGAVRTGWGCRAAAKAGRWLGGSSPAQTRSRVDRRACGGAGVVAMAAARQAMMVLHLSLFALLHLTPTADCYSPPPAARTTFLLQGLPRRAPLLLGLLPPRSRHRDSLHARAKAWCSRAARSLSPPSLFSPPLPLFQLAPSTLPPLSTLCHSRAHERRGNGEPERHS